MTARLRLPSGLVALAEARRVHDGFEVVLEAERGALTEEFDRRYEASVAQFQRQIDQSGDRAEIPPLTGAEALMSGVELLAPEGTLPPHGVVRMCGGSGSEWTVTWRSSDWAPDQVLLRLANQSVLLPLAAEAET